MRLAVSPDGETFGEPKIVETPKDFEEGVALFKKIYKELTSGSKVEKAVGGIAGPFNRSKEALINSPHLPGWNGKPLKQKLTEAVGVEVYLENDTAMAGLGEATKGAARDFEIVVYMTISTGVGGVRIVDKKIDANVFGFEPGHQTIDADGTIYPRSIAFEGGGNFGHLDSYVGGAGIQRRLGKKPSEIKDEKILDEMARLLAFGLNNTIVHWSPDVVVLGGGMIQEEVISIGRVKFHLKNILKIFPELPEIKKAELGDLGGLHGALAYLRQLHK